MKRVVAETAQKGKWFGQFALNLIYPPRCMNCESSTDLPDGLCQTCWSETVFLTGQGCTRCGAPVPTANDHAVCEDCHRYPPGWDRGAAALLYDGTGRSLSLALKHGDRLDTAPVLAKWMARSGRALLAQAEIITVVPLHYRRLLRRRYNQSVELARHLPRGKARFIPDVLQRYRATPSQAGKTRAGRRDNLRDALRVQRKYVDLLHGKRLLIVDDVMTTGATLSACAELCRAAGALGVDTLVLARAQNLPLTKGDERS